MQRTYLVTRLSVAFLSVLTSALVWAHGDEDHSKKPASAPKAKASASALLETSAPQRLADGSVFVSKAVQRQLAIRTMLAESADLPKTQSLLGTVLADPNAGGRVQASQAGRVELARGSLPTVGQRVQKGQVLAYLKPVISSLDRGNAQSILADTSAQLSIAEAKLKRYEQLAEALPKATLEAVRYEVESLKKRQSSVGASLANMEALLAPVSGVISSAHVMAGQVVDAKETLFEIIDPGRLMVEALAYDPILLSDIDAANASWKSDLVASKVSSVQSVALQWIGGGQQMRGQALPLLFRLKQPNSKWVVGQPVTVYIQTKTKIEGMPLPASAVLRSSGGEMVVWVHTEAERFVPKKVKIDAINGSEVAVLSGLESGERVVVAGASLLSQIK